MNQLKIQYWKWYARRRHYAIDSLYDQYSCGGSVIDDLTGGRLSQLKKEKMEAIEKLKALDPACPK